jgi:uncharacterized protein YqeY
MLEDRFTQDLKTALVAHDELALNTLRGIKSAIIYLKVAEKLPREAPLPDATIITLLQKEAKKRQESADLYMQGGNKERADLELKEKTLIGQYLPVQLSDTELGTIVDEVLAITPATGPAAIGSVIGAVKQRVGATADGATIARLVKERLL